MSDNITQIAFEESWDQQLKNWKDLGYFKTEQAAVKLAISIAIYHKLDFENIRLENKKNKYGVGSFDSDLKLKNTVKALYPNYEGQEYKAIELLADAGLKSLSNHIKNNNSLNIKILLSNAS